MSSNFPFVAFNQRHSAASARFKQETQDFIVDEVLNFPFDGQPNHTYIKLEKENKNTRTVINLLSTLFRVDQADIGYAGLKDKRAVTRQWFSLPGKIDDFRLLALNDIEGLCIEDVAWHGKKLMTGAILYNQFDITLRQVSGNSNDVVASLDFVKQRGFPNYFGDQRFGYNDSNIKVIKEPGCTKLDTNSQQYYMLVSAARSWLFNLCLAARIERHQYTKPMDGDCLMDIDSGRCATYSQQDGEQDSWGNDARSITGPLLGMQGFLSSGRCLALEEEVTRDEKALRAFIAKANVNSQRRKLTERVNKLSWHWQTDHDLNLRFQLNTGAYATAMLKEVFSYFTENNNEQSERTE